MKTVMIHIRYLCYIKDTSHPSKGMLTGRSEHQKVCNTEIQKQLHQRIRSIEEAGEGGGPKMMTNQRIGVKYWQIQWGGIEIRCDRFVTSNICIHR